ncbi:MAG: 4-(cytidine 5'-diphospho)-2-C-methyl-D-erythritol kinase [Spirulinaceae cyanobacterium RM2_2_10]|nr:4-(cytidine 5'-diphospho)-2-C-methyl-D-erythritol kinase [Spirulinaceae cyanobacterium SM2_1_0]NJO18984.1 4-(cytidine 5'-diphospho)-2-C-methyl-D-erythritol kinase [Spirulinaceae cyanobacterium RM2_2_10]
MKSCTLIAPAKVNFYLEIIGDRPDGFHELVMLMQSIALADRVTVTAVESPGLRVHCEQLPGLAETENLAYKAAQLMQTEFSEAAAHHGGLEITIEKEIPVAAGLAGGSGNAAAVLVGLDLLWDLGLTQPELQVLAARLGSDVPFSLVGGTAIATGRGEQLDAIKTPPNLWVVLAKYADLEISTAWVYQTYRQQFADTYADALDMASGRAAQVRSGALVAALLSGDRPSIARNLYNDLEKVVLPFLPQVAELHRTLQNTEALGALMSGSGPTVFALCESETQAVQVEQELHTAITEPSLRSWVTPLSGHGIQLVTTI